MLPHHFAIASEWAKNRGNPKHLAEVWVREVLGIDWEYRCDDGDNLERYVTGMARMIKASRRGELHSLVYEFDVEAPRFGDFFCWEHCFRYDESLHDGGCRKADSFRRAKRGEKITLVDLVGVDVVYVQSLIDKGRAKVRL